MPTYDPNQRLCILDDVAPVDNVINLDVMRDIFSDAKHQWKDDNTLNKLIFPWVTVGGNLLPSGSVVPRFFFLIPPWKIRPFESDHTLFLSGNIFTEDGSNLTVPTLGDFTVVVEIITDVGPQDPLSALLSNGQTFSEAMVEIIEKVCRIDGVTQLTLKNSK